MVRPALFKSIVGLSLLALGGCGSHAVTPVQGPGDDVGYTDATDVVVAGTDTWLVTGDPDGCVQIGDQCLDIPTIKQQYCGDANAQADIVVIGGKVVDVVCYPPATSGVSIDKAGTTADGTTSVPQNKNNSVITFAPDTDGKPVESDVRLDAENVSIIGNGIDRTIIKGNLTLNSNNSHVRGLTVGGNLVLEKNCNGGTVAFVKVVGDLTVAANDVVILNTIVLGNLSVTGHNISLINVGVQGKLGLTSNALVCDSNYAFTDSNANGLVEPAEKGAALTCGVSGQ
jgi:hypothetical protein